MYSRDNYEKELSKKTCALFKQFLIRYNKDAKYKDDKGYMKFLDNVVKFRQP